MILTNKKDICQSKETNGQQTNSFINPKSHHANLLSPKV